MDSPISTIPYKGHVINTYYDPDPESPREWDNLGTMVCFHRRYTLGDAEGARRCRNDIRASIHYSEAWDDEYSDHYRDLAAPRAMMETAEQCGFLILPLYLYDHSGLYMNTSGFSCPWDSGQVGFIYATRGEIMDELGKHLKRKRYCEHVRKSAAAILAGEVETYSQYLQGQVYGWTVTDPDGEEIHSCWGYYGENAAEQDAKATVDAETAKTPELPFPELHAGA